MQIRDNVAITIQNCIKSDLISVVSSFQPMQIISIYCIQSETEHNIKHGYGRIH